MIEHLTKEQEATFPYYVDKWTKIGRATGEANIEAAIPHINKAYSNANLTPPKYVFHAQSPFQALHMIYMVECLSNFKDTYNRKAPEKVYPETWYNTFERLYSQYSAQYTEREWNPTVKEKMLNFLKNRYTNKKAYSESASRIVNEFMYGNQEAFWLSYYNFFQEQFPNDSAFVEPIVPFIELSNHIGWWSAYEEAIFIQDRPNYIHINVDNELHNDFGPAIEYPDGFCLYAKNNKVFDDTFKEDVFSKFKLIPPTEEDLTSMVNNAITTGNTKVKGTKTVSKK